MFAFSSISAEYLQKIRIFNFEISHLVYTSIHHLHAWMYKLGVISQERLKIEVNLPLSTNRKSYMLRRLAQLQMTLSGLEWPFHASRAFSAVAQLLVLFCICISFDCMVSVYLCVSCMCMCCCLLA